MLTNSVRKIAQTSQRNFATIASIHAREIIDSRGNPYLEGAHAPVSKEITELDLKVIGEVPKDLNGIYLRNGPNPKHNPKGVHHWFDGDGMLHAVRFEGGTVTYQNRWVATDSLQEEIGAGAALWQGIKDPPRKDRPDMPIKNTSNTDVKFYAGTLLSMWYLGGAVYQCRPGDLSTIGKLELDRLLADVPALFGTCVNSRKRDPAGRAPMRSHASGRSGCWTAPG